MLEYFDKAAKYQANLDMRQEFVVILNESDILTQKIAEDEKDIN